MKKLIAAFAFGSLLASCVPSTPQTRIQQHPEKFSALRESDRALVEQGKIARGMPRDAVYLAWGRPSGTFQGSREGEISERWDYAGTRPVYTTGFFGGYGYGPYQGCGPYRGRGSYVLGPEIAYVPYRVASVWFLDNRVDSWERQQ